MAPITTKMYFLEYTEKWESVVTSKDCTADEVHSMAPGVIRRYEEMCRLSVILPQDLEPVLTSLCQFMIALLPEKEVEKIIENEKKAAQEVDQDDSAEIRRCNSELVKLVINSVPCESVEMFITAIKVGIVIGGVMHDQRAGTNVSLTSDIIKHMDMAHDEDNLMLYVRRYIICNFSEEEKVAFDMIAASILAR